MRWQSTHAHFFRLQNSHLYSEVSLFRQAFIYLQVLRHKFSTYVIYTVRSIGKASHFPTPISQRSWPLQEVSLPVEFWESRISSRGQLSTHVLDSLLMLFSSVSITPLHSFIRLAHLSLHIIIIVFLNAALGSAHANYTCERRIWRCSMFRYCCGRF